MNLISNGSFQHNSHGVRLTVTIAVEQSYKLGTAMPVSQCHAQQQMFGTFHRHLVTATQISLAMDCESRDVLMPEVREKISDRKSTKELGGEITPELKKFADGGQGIS